MQKILKKGAFIKIVVAIVAILFVIRLCIPQVNESITSAAPADSLAAIPLVAVSDTSSQYGDSACVAIVAARNSGLLTLKELQPRLDFSVRHRIYSVPSYRTCFPDVQEVQFPVALANGVATVQNRAEAEQRKKELLYVGLNPYYQIDPSMNRSIPYLVPKASHLLQHIGRRFLDSLAVKGIPLHKMIVTSVLRTEEDVYHLRRINGNASEQSCHRFGTTFDISYNRYHTVSPLDEAARRAVRSDSLKFILSEVLRDVRAEGLCYVKYEVKQGCFHITVR